MNDEPDIDDLDAIMKEREVTRRETSAGGLRGTVLGIKGIGGVDLASFAAEPEKNPSPAPIPPTSGAVPEEDDEYNDDDFADFDFDPVPPPPIIKTPVVDPVPTPTVETIVAVQEQLEEQVKTVTLAQEPERSRTSSAIAPSDRRVSNPVTLVPQNPMVTSTMAADPKSLPIVVTVPTEAITPAKVEEIVQVKYDDYDPFDDFEYDAKKPKKTLIMDPKAMKEFQNMDVGRKSEASNSSGQDKSRTSDGVNSSRNLSGMNNMKSALAQLVTGANSRVSEPSKVTQEDLRAEQEEEEEFFTHGRERSTNTVAAGPVSRPIMTGGFRGDAPIDDPTNLRFIDSLVSKSKTSKMQEEALRQEFETKDLKELIAQDLSDISLSDQELDEPSALQSPTREASKTRGAVDMPPESAAFRNKEAKLRAKLDDLKQKGKDKSKMHSIFLAKPQEEFARMAEGYHDEIQKVKESTGKLKVDLDSMNMQSARASLAEISVENIRPNFYEFFGGKYGHPRCFVPDRTGASFIVGTEKGQLVVYDQKMIENNFTLALSSTAEDFPVAMFPDWDNDLIWVGMNRGDIWVVKHNPSDNTLKKVAHSKEFTANVEVLDLVISKNREHLVVIDGEYRIFYAKLDKTKPLDKARISSSQISFTKRDVLPHLEMKEVAPDIYLCVITAGVQVTIFEFKPEVKNQKNPNYTKMLEMELDQSPNLDSSVMLPLYPVGHEPAKAEGSTTSTDSHLITLADEKGDSDTVRKGRRVSETNESYPLLVKFTDDPNRSLALAVAFKRTLYIFDLLPTVERTFKTQSITEIQMRARAVNISFFSTGKLIVMDIYNDFYLVDVPLGVRYSEAHGPLSKQASNTAADLAALGGGLVPSAVPVNQPRATSVRSTSVRKSFLTNSINKTREFLSGMNGNKTPSNVNGTLFVDPTQEFDQSCVFLIYPYGNVDQILSTQTRTRSLTSYSSLISRSPSGEYFFINQKGLIRLCVMNWKQYLDLCLSKHNYLKALKTVNELLDGEFETLRRPPPKRQMPAELAPYIKRVVEEFVEELKMAPPEDIEIFTNYCMMTLIKNGMQEYITDDLEALFDQHDLIGYFWKSLVLLFRSQLIPSLDFETIMRIVAFLEQDPLQKQQFILYLFNRKLYREMLFNNLANRGNINLLFFLSDKVDEPHKSTFALEYVKDSIDIHSDDHEKRAKFYFQMFWYVTEFVDKKLDKREVKYQDHSWYILNWFFNPDLVAFLVKTDLRAYLEGWFLLFEKKFPQKMAFNNGLDLLEGYQYPINEIINLKKTCPEMVSLLSTIYSIVKHNPKDLNYFYFWIAIVKFHKVPCIELNDNALKELVLTLIKNINEIVSDPRLDINHEDLNILIFATFTEHKEIFVDSSELRDLIMKNEKSLRLLYHEMNRDISATFSLYRKLSKDNEQFKFRMFQWLKKGIEIKGEKEEMMNLIKGEFGFLVDFHSYTAHRGCLVSV